MVLPDYVKKCIDALECAGFRAYAVGGCVRDSLLDQTPQDYDLCTNALPDQTEGVFSQYRLVLAGKKHGTVGVITEGGVVEITTYRTEGGYRDNRHPDWVEFVPNIEADLARRDFTVNAMAWSPYHGFADPFGGQPDLEHQILRAVGDPETRFREDSLRILRGIRFAVKYRLTPETATMDAMNTLAPLMENLARERVFDELCKFLLLTTAQDLTRFGTIVASVIPELGPMIGFDQHSPHHAYDVFTHTAHVVENVPADLPLRWAALLHDTGKIPTFTRDENGRGHFYGHAPESVRIADEILRRLKAPTKLREEVVFLVDKHMTKIEPTKKNVRRWLSRLGEDAVLSLLTFQEADMSSKGTGKPQEISQFSQIRQLIAEIREENACLSIKDLAVNGHDLMDLGIQGRAIGDTLSRLLGLVLDEQIENTKEVLLNAVRQERL